MADIQCISNSLLRFCSNWAKSLYKRTPHPTPETSQIQGLAYIDTVPYTLGGIPKSEPLAVKLLDNLLYISQYYCHVWNHRTIEGVALLPSQKETHQKMKIDKTIKKVVK